MTGKTYYDILGVKRDASTTEIRQAYVLRSKVMHPDRFNQATQAAEWQLANQLLQELNQANSTLRDPTLRRQYDESVFGRSAQPPPRPTATPKQPPPRPTTEKTKKTGTQRFNVSPNGTPPPVPPRNIWAPNVFQGGFRYSEQPMSVKMRLKQRSENRVSDQLRIPFQANSTPTNLVLGGFAAYCLYDTALPGTQAWTGAGYVGLFFWCLIMGALLGSSLDGLIKSMVNPLKSWVVITPLYLILMDYGEVFAWPLWQINSIGSSGDKNKFNVVVQVGQKGDRIAFTLPNAGAYSRFYNFVGANQKRLETARLNKDTRFFDEINDLVAATPTRSDVVAYIPPIPTKTLTNLVLIAAIAVYGYAAFKSPAARPVAAAQPTVAPAPVAPAPYVPPSPPVPSYPVQTPPPDGAVYTYAFGGRSVDSELQPPASSDNTPGPTYPFPVKTADGSGGVDNEMRPIVCPLTIHTPAGDNYFLKLIDVQTNSPVMSFYVSANCTVTVRVPLGTYAIHCAFGKTWYGADHLFGPTTGYSKLDDTFSFTEDATSYSTETLTLYPVSNGNLQTTALNQKDF